MPGCGKELNVPRRDGILATRRVPPRRLPFGALTQHDTHLRARSWLIVLAGKRWDGYHVVSLRVRVGLGKRTRIYITSNKE